MISFRTVTGRRVDMEHPRPEDVDIRDIACGLSRVCRFNGQIRAFYSVAQHSCFVARLVPYRLRRAALLHDASEAYLNDLSRNLKHSDYLAGYRTLEGRWAQTISDTFHLSCNPEETRLIKAADDLAAVWEHAVLRQGQTWQDNGARLIEHAVAIKWVGSSFLDMANLGWFVPAEWTPLAYDAAEAMFLKELLAHT